jgi:hypothetical protein
MIVALCWRRLLLLLQLLTTSHPAASQPATAQVAVLRAHLLLNASTRSGAVAEVEHASVPPGTTWFHVRPATPPPPKPDGLLHSLWYARTAPKPVGQQPQGLQQIPFGASCEFAAGCVYQSQRNFSFVVEAWSDRNDLGGPGTPALLAQSAPLLFEFDDRHFASGLRFLNFSAVEHAPGHVTISCLPNSATLYAMAEQITWFGYGVATDPPTGLPTFTIDERLADGVYSTRLVSPPSISVSLSSPGTYYVGMYGAFNGDETGGDQPHMGEKTLAFFPSGPTGYGTFQPYAIVVPFENGTHAPTPRGFTGAIHVTAPIPGDWRLPMHRATATVFDGGTLYLPLVKGKANPKVGPHCVELELPIGLSLYLPVEFANTTDVSALPGGGAVTKGYYRVRITNTNNDDWGYLNWDVKLRIRVAPALLQEGAVHVGGRRTFSGGRARAFSGAANQARADNWQAWTLTVVALAPVPQLPKRLTTGFCWDGAAEFGTSAADIGMWRKLGFNVIPTAGVSVAPFLAGSTAPPSGLLSPANRTGPDWEGVKYGVITNGMEVFTWLHLSPAAAQAVNLSSYGVPDSELASERAQLVAAAEFFQATGFMDVSYRCENRLSFESFSCKNCRFTKTGSGQRFKHRESSKKEGSAGVCSIGGT